MKIIFWGTSSFALPCLEKLSATGHKIVSVVTQPDRRQGRHLKLLPPPVKIKSGILNLSVLQPHNPNSHEFINHLRSLDADLFVVVSYGEILKKEIIEIPRLYAINLHASLLPKYRGAAPINWAILQGETETGVSIIRMNAKMDAGDIILQEKMSISDEDTAVSLGNRLSEKGAELILRTIDLIGFNRAEFKPQDETQASFAPVLKKKDGKISWQKSASETHNQVRALQPWPGVYCVWGNKQLKLWKTRVLDSGPQGVSGEIVGLVKEGIIVSTGKGNLCIEELQMECGRRMSSGQFILGHALKTGEYLE
jgi:methionyl-tRNA formyltransferase